MAKLTLKKFPPGSKFISFMEVQSEIHVRPFGSSSSTWKPCITTMESGAARKIVRGKVIPISLGSAIRPPCHVPEFLPNLS